MSFRYWKRSNWKPGNYKSRFNNYGRSFNYRDFCYEEFDFGFNPYEKSKTPIIREFHVPPVFDHVYPRYEIRLETQYYFGYLSLRLKSESPEHISALRDGVLKFIGNDIVYIIRIDKDGAKTKIFDNMLLQGVPNDPLTPGFVKVLLNGRDVCRYVAQANKQD